MADSREMTFGLDFGLKDAIDQLEPGAGRG